MFKKYRKGQVMALVGLCSVCCMQIAHAAHFNAFYNGQQQKLGVVPLALAPAIPAPLHHQPAKKLVKVTVYPGSIRQNVTRLAHFFGWEHVVWNVPTDYQWVGKTNMQAQNFYGVMRELLGQYPLQAVFYQGNHVLAINARTLQS